MSEPFGPDVVAAGRPADTARPDWLGPASQVIARQYGLSPAVARRLLLFRLRWRAQQQYGFSRAEAERLVFWFWLAVGRGEAVCTTLAGEHAEEVRR